MCVQYRWGVQYHGGGGGVFSTVGDVMIHVGDIMIHVGGYHNTYEGYHEYRGGCSVPWSTQITKDLSPTVLNTLHGTHDIPNMHHGIPHGTEHSHGTQGNPHGTNYILPRY